MLTQLSTARTPSSLSPRTSSKQSSSASSPSSSSFINSSSSCSNSRSSFLCVSQKEQEQQMLKKLLLASVKLNKLDNIKMILGAGVDVNCQDEDGNTALILALLKHQRLNYSLNKNLSFRFPNPEIGQSLVQDLLTAIENCESIFLTLIPHMKTDSLLAQNKDQLTAIGLANLAGLEKFAKLIKDTIIITYAKSLFQNSHS